MSRFTHFSVVATALALPLAACDSDRPTPRTTSAETTIDTPVVTAGPVSTPAVVESSAATPAVAVSASYEDGEAAFQAGRYQDASAIFAAYAERKPENVWGHYMKGLSEWRAGELEQAIESFDQALAIDSTHRKSLHNSTRVLLELDRNDEALERIETALAVDSTSAETWRLVGRVRDELGQPEAAIEAYKHALVIDERDVWAMNNLGLIYIQLGRYEEALPPLARAVELRSNAPVFQNNFGSALERTGRFTLARRAYEDALAADSGYTKASVALERVTPLTEAPDVEPVDFAELTQRFRMQVRLWRDGMIADTTDAEETAETVDTMGTADTVEVDSVDM